MTKWMGMEACSRPAQSPSCAARVGEDGIPAAKESVLRCKLRLRQPARETWGVSLRAYRAIKEEDGDGSEGKKEWTSLPDRPPLPSPGPHDAKSLPARRFCPYLC